MANQFYMLLLDFLGLFTKHFHAMHYFIYKYLLFGDKSMEDFYYTDVNVGLWIFTTISMMLFFGLSFIELKDCSTIQRRNRIRLKLMAPVLFFLSPLPLFAIMGVEAFIAVYGIIIMYKKVQDSVQMERQYENTVLGIISRQVNEVERTDSKEVFATFAKNYKESIQERYQI